MTNRLCWFWKWRGSAGDWTGEYFDFLLFDGKRFCLKRAQFKSGKLEEGGGVCRCGRSQQCKYIREKKSYLARF